MVTLVQTMLDRINDDRQKRQPWMEYWQKLFDVMAPHYADFTEKQSPGTSRVNEIYDGTARLEARSMSTTLGGLLKSRTSQWFWGEYEDDALMEMEEVKLFLEIKRQLMWNAIYASAARFDQRSSETDLMLTVAGNGYLFPTLNRMQNGFTFKSYHPSKVTIREDSDGVVNSTTLTETMTASQAVEKFGMDQVGMKTRENFNGDSKQRAKRSDFVQLIIPRDDRDTEKVGQKSMPFASIWVDMQSEHVIKEGGFPEFPIACPRWETSPGEVYGRGPAAYAISDARTLNTIGKTILVGAQLRVDPPKWVAADGVISPVRTFPGGLTVIDVDVAKDLGGPPMGQLDVAGDIPLGRDIQQDYREMVRQAFYRDVFRLPQDGPDMTATEILERKEEFLRTIGPVLGRLESDYIGVITERVHNIMDRMGVFPDPPEVVAGMEIKWKYISPVQQVRRQLDAAGFARTMEILAGPIEMRPDILDNFDFDKITRDAPDYAGLPQEWLLPADEVEERRAARAEQERQMAMIEAGQGLASAAKDIGQSGLIEGQGQQRALPAPSQ